MYRTRQGYHRLFIDVHRKSFSHIVGVFIHVARVILEDRPVHGVAQLVVEGDGDGVAHTDKQINKVTILRVRELLQSVHQFVGQTYKRGVRWSPLGR